MKLSFSLAKLHQLSEIRTIFLKSMAHIGDRMGVGQPATAFSNMRDYYECGNLYVLEEDGIVLAAAALHETDNCLHVDYLAVRQDQQHKGLGKRMLTELEMLTESRELNQLQLHTPEVMDELIAFYTKQGFSETARILPSHGRDPLLRVHFSKPVTMNDLGMDPEFDHDRQMA
nr:GNAT family N-acetyltransferase [uncultured Cohaesibacter sp.]